MKKLTELMSQVILPETISGRIRVVGILLAEIAAIEAEEGREFWYSWSPHVTWFEYNQYNQLWDKLSKTRHFVVYGYINLKGKTTIKDIEYLIKQLTEVHR